MRAALSAGFKSWVEDVVEVGVRLVSAAVQVDPVVLLDDVDDVSVDDVEIDVVVLEVVQCAVGAVEVPLVELPRRWLCWRLWWKCCGCWWRCCWWS